MPPNTHLHSIQLSRIVLPITASHSTTYAVVHIRLGPHLDYHYLLQYDNGNYTFEASINNVRQIAYIIQPITTVTWCLQVDRQSTVILNHLIGHIKTTQLSNGPLYSNTVICTLAVDGWTVTFDTARRGLGGLRPRPVPSSLYQMQQPTHQRHSAPTHII